MLKPDLSSIETLMKRDLVKLKRGSVAVSQDITELALRQFFGFLPRDVEGIHTHKKDEGEGLWFRLKDGRVFSKIGQPAAPDPALYDNPPPPK